MIDTLIESIINPPAAAGGLVKLGLELTKWAIYKTTDRGSESLLARRLGSALKKEFKKEVRFTKKECLEFARAFQDKDIESVKSRIQWVGGQMKKLPVWMMRLKKRTPDF